MTRAAWIKPANAAWSVFSRLLTSTFNFRHADREAGLTTFFVYDTAKRKNHLYSLLGFETVLYKDNEFAVRMTMDGAAATREGDIEVRIHSPLAALTGVKAPDLEDQSLRPDEQKTIFVLCDRIPGFDRNLTRFLAMREVINSWKGDPHKSEAAHRLAEEREINDLPKLERAVQEGIKTGIRQGHVIFRGSSRALSSRAGQKSPGEALRAELAAFWPTLYPKWRKRPSSSRAASTWRPPTSAFLPTRTTWKHFYASTQRTLP
ncbi:MAG: hypothetical protein ACE15E_04045 [Acidobacteriota bacterium]